MKRLVWTSWAALLVLACDGEGLLLGAGHECRSSDGPIACGATCSPDQEGETCDPQEGATGTTATCKDGIWICSPDPGLDPVECGTSKGELNCGLPCDAPDDNAGCEFERDDGTVETATCRGGVWVCSATPAAPVECGADEGELSCGLPCDAPDDSPECELVRVDGTVESAICRGGVWVCSSTPAPPVECGHDEGELNCGLPCSASDDGTSCDVVRVDGTVDVAVCLDGIWQCSDALEGCRTETGALNCDAPCYAHEEGQRCGFTYADGSRDDAVCANGVWECSHTPAAPVECGADEGELGCGLPCSASDDGTSCDVVRVDGTVDVAACIDGIWQCSDALEGCRTVTGALNCDAPCYAHEEGSGCGSVHSDGSSDDAVCVNGVWECSHTPTPTVDCDTIGAEVACELPCDDFPEGTGCQLQQDDGVIVPVVCRDAAWRCYPDTDPPPTCATLDGELDCGAPCDAEDEGEACTVMRGDGTGDVAYCVDGAWLCADDSQGCFGEGGELNCGAPCVTLPTHGGCGSAHADGSRDEAVCTDGVWECTHYPPPPLGCDIEGGELQCGWPCATSESCSYQHEDGALDEMVCLDGVWECTHTPAG